VTAAIKLHRAICKILKFRSWQLSRGNTVFCPMDQRGFLGRGDVGSDLGRQRRGAAGQIFGANRLGFDHSAPAGRLR
jgi:hypothetical protein